MSCNLKIIHYLGITYMVYLLGTLMFKLVKVNEQVLLQVCNSLLVLPGTAAQYIKVHTNKQKPSDVCTAHMVQNSDKMPSCSNVQPALQQTQYYHSATGVFTGSYLYCRNKSNNNPRSIPFNVVRTLGYKPLLQTINDGLYI